MKNILLSLLIITSLFSAKEQYSSYISTVIGPTFISRDYSVEMSRNGQFTNLETGEVINGLSGKTYSFNQKLSFTRVDFLYGIQKGDLGNFYEVGIYTSNVLDEIFISMGKTFPENTFSKKWFNPFLKGSLGLGYTGAEIPKPSSLSYNFGLGFLSDPMKDVKSRVGFDFAQRNWLDISHTYGQEIWKESETRFYLGVTYFY